MDVNTFFDRTKRFLIDLLSRETTSRAVRSQATTWIRFVKDEVEKVELAFNSRMLAVYNLIDMDEIVSEMIEHMQQQIKNPALRDSKFVFDGVIHIEIVKWGFWHKLPLLPLLWHANAMDENEKFPYLLFHQRFVAKFLSNFPRITLSRNAKNSND